MASHVFFEYMVFHDDAPGCFAKRVDANISQSGRVWVLLFALEACRETSNTAVVLESLCNGCVH